jgi:hypothetical protein
LEDISFLLFWAQACIDRLKNRGLQVRISGSSQQFILANDAARSATHNVVYQEMRRWLKAKVFEISSTICEPCSESPTAGWKCRLLILIFYFCR